MVDFDSLSHQWDMALIHRQVCEDRLQVLHMHAADWSQSFSDKSKQWDLVFLCLNPVFFFIHQDNAQRIKVG